jgi:hypothetical protein
MSRVKYGLWIIRISIIKAKCLCFCFFYIAWQYRADCPTYLSEQWSVPISSYLSICKYGFIIYCNVYRFREAAFICVSFIYFLIFLDSFPLFPSCAALFCVDWNALPLFLLCLLISDTFYDVYFPLCLSLRCAFSSISSRYSVCCVQMGCSGHYCVCVSGILQILIFIFHSIL